MMATATLLYEQKSFLWIIPNFSKVCKSDKLLNKQHLKYEMNAGVKSNSVPTLKWKCRLQTVTEEDQDNETRCCISIANDNVPVDLRESSIKVQFQIADQEKGRYFLDDVFTVRMTEFSDTLSGVVSSESFSVQPKNMPFLTTDGALEIQVTVAVFPLGAQNAEFAVLEAYYKDRFVKNLQTQLTDIRNDPLSSNTTATRIISKDGVEFPVDRVILSARSPVFRGMFESSMTEDQEGVVKVTDIDSKPLEVLLHFIHTGELILNWKNEGVIKGLVYGAHKYMIKDLLSFLDQVLGFVCTMENCGKLMGLAKTLELKLAQEKLLEYFKKNLVNNVDEILKFAEDTATAGRLMVASESEEEGDEQPRPKRKRENSAL